MNKPRIKSNFKQCYFAHVQRMRSTHTYLPMCPFHERVISPSEFQSKHIESSPTLTIRCFKMRQSHTLALCPYNVNEGSHDTCIEMQVRKIVLRHVPHKKMFKSDPHSRVYRNLLYKWLFKCNEWISKQNYILTNSAARFRLYSPGWSDVESVVFIYNIEMTSQRCLWHSECRWQKLPYIQAD